MNTFEEEIDAVYWIKLDTEDFYAYSYEDYAFTFNAST